MPQISTTSWVRYVFECEKVGGSAKIGAGRNYYTPDLEEKYDPAGYHSDVVSETGYDKSDLVNELYAYQETHTV